MLDIWIYYIYNFKGFQMGFELMLCYDQDLIFVNKYLRKVIYQLFLLSLCSPFSQLCGWDLVLFL